ncbi:jg4490 [Pararge aegeria aegeria]|uniref:Jg4490 protein n=1 Tax=Pararge aegeria aegeria TaxID=348720 RepID=A0A8S4QV96_9NEOP|nr:jg4490 [Pararge aegeria aegeria]
MIFITNCYAKITINITVASSKGGIILHFGGRDTKLISDKEVNIFNITDVNLKRGIRVEFGDTPNDVYLKDPTPYGNLYQKFKWQQVNREIIVKSASVLDIINENIVLTVHEHINNATRELKIPIKIFENVENTFKSSWSKNGLPDDEIYYDINIDFFNEKKINFENKWRNDSLRTASLLFGYQTAGKINIAPGYLCERTYSNRRRDSILIYYQWMGLNS